MLFMKTTVKTGLAAFLLLAISCTKQSTAVHDITAQSVDSSVTAHYIGQRYGGGIIFYMSSNKHGLIADTVDLPIIPWYAGKFIKTGADNTGIGSGQLNTNLIVSAQGTMANYAALECKNSIRNGHSDWFLPSKNELNKLFKQRHVVGAAGFFGAGYWSSSETDSAHVWWQSFSTGGQSVGGKNSTTLHVRAIRDF